jgi:ABC-type polysaccharide/polyol phosphate transport system ATPase subunit
MILLDNVTVQVPGWRAPITILRDQTVLFNAGARVSILAPAGSGRTTLARVVGGVKHPVRGRVFIDGSVGWPIGFSGLLNPTLTLAENIAHVAGLVHVTTSEIGAVVAWLCDSDKILERRVMTLAPSERALAIYAISLAVPADHLIADDKIIVSDARFAARSEQLLRQRLDGAGLIFISRNAKLLERWCNEHYVLIQCRLQQIETPAEGQAILDELDANEEAEPLHV